MTENGFYLSQSSKITGGWKILKWRKLVFKKMLYKQL